MGRRRSAATFPLARIAECLARIGERLDVHVLVADGELVEIALRGPRLAAEPIELVLQHIGHVAEHAVAIGQLKIPARVVGDRARIP